MKSNPQTVTHTPSGSIIFWVGESGGRQITIFGMNQEEIEKVVKLFGKTSYTKEAEDGKETRRGWVEIGGLQISMHSKEYVSKEQEAPTPETT